MKLTSLILCLCAIALPTAFVSAKEEDNDNDEYGLFYFDASQKDFTNGAIYPKACVSL